MATRLYFSFSAIQAGQALEEKLNGRKTRKRRIKEDTGKQDMRQSESQETGI
jgi:hypothetical protein